MFSRRRRFFQSQIKNSVTTFWRVRGQNPSKIRQTKSLNFHDCLDLNETVVNSSGRCHSPRSCPMGWLEGFNRRSARPKPLTSLPTADRACWKIFFEICWEAEIDDQIRRKIRARKNRKSLKMKLHRTATERTFVWCPRVLWRPKTRPNGSLRLSPWSLARLPVVFRRTLGALRSMKNPSSKKLKIMKN